MIKEERNIDLTLRILDPKQSTIAGIGLKAMDYQGCEREYIRHNILP